MIYHLDTNTVIAVVNNRPTVSRERYEIVRAGNDPVFISSIVLFELTYGTAKSQRQRQNAQALATFLLGGVTVLPFDEQDAEAAGTLRASLESAGKPIGPFDLLIAGQAVRRKATLVTANAREFGRVTGLICEDWTK